MKEGDCQTCWGDGRVVMERKGPVAYLAWVQLPVASAAALLAGFVRPVPCPHCGGTGKDRMTARALDVEKHLDPANVLCTECIDRGWLHKTLYKHVPGEPADPREGVMQCTSCLKVTEEQAKTQHALVCGCGLPWINLNEASRG